MFSSNKFEVFSLLKNGSKYKLINFNIDKKHEIENNELNKKTFKNKIKKNKQKKQLQNKNVNTNKNYTKKRKNIII